MWNFVPSLWIKTFFPFLKITVALLAVVFVCVTIKRHETAVYVLLVLYSTDCRDVTSTHFRPCRWGIPLQEGGAIPQSLTSGCSHRENILWIGWDVQGLPQCGVQVSASAVNQTDLCIATAFCYTLAPCAISKLHTVCFGLELLFKPLQFGEICNDMRGCPAINHQTPHVDTRCLLSWSSVSPETLRASSRSLRCFLLQLRSRCVVLLQ